MKINTDHLRAAAAAAVASDFPTEITVRLSGIQVTAKRPITDGGLRRVASATRIVAWHDLTAANFNPLIPEIARINKELEALCL